MRPRAARPELQNRVSIAARRAAFGIGTRRIRPPDGRARTRIPGNDELGALFGRPRSWRESEHPDFWKAEVQLLRSCPIPSSEFRRASLAEFLRMRSGVPAPARGLSTPGAMNEASQFFFEGLPHFAARPPFSKSGSAWGNFKLSFEGGHRSRKVRPFSAAHFTKRWTERQFWKPRKRMTWKPLKFLFNEFGFEAQAWH